MLTLEYMKSSLTSCQKVLLSSASKFKLASASLHGNPRSLIKATILARRHHMGFHVSVGCLVPVARLQHLCPIPVWQARSTVQRYCLRVETPNNWVLEMFVLVAKQKIACGLLVPSNFLMNVLTIARLH